MENLNTYYQFNKEFLLVELARLLKGLTAPKDNLLAYTWCVLEEVEFDHWGIGGNAVTPEILQAVIEGQT
jgi:hypothetical protein